MDFINSFPADFTPLAQQVQILNEIQKIFDSGKKFAIVQAPTGSGKSFISKTLAAAGGSCSSTFRKAIESYRAYGVDGEEECANEKPFGGTALTITKALQDQYNTLFDDCRVLKGKSNYQCAIDENLTVDVAPCIHVKTLKKSCCDKGICPYYNARNDTVVADFNALNYKMFFSLPNHIRRRKYLICDEASELEDEIVSNFTLSINHKFIKQCGINLSKIDDDRGDLYGWLGSLSRCLLARIEEIEDEIKGSKKSKFAETIKVKYVYLKTLQNDTKMVLETWNDSEYIHEKGEDVTTFYPLKVDKLAQYLFDSGEKVVLMSATIIDPKRFAKSLGITDYGYVEADSTFDAKNAPIFVSNRVGKLNQYTLVKSLPTISSMIQEICDKHRGQKGIIHTHTNMITKHLSSTLRGSRFIFREPGKNNEQIMDEHTRDSTDSVIVSPSMSFGVDLKDDLARFQIIIKAPYPPLTSLRVKELTKIDNQWYTNKMLSQLVQACGRGVRSKDDRCITYIIDGKIVEEVINNRSILPKYFIDRFM